MAVASVIVVVAAQPVRSPWWLYADADATYTASGIELMAGEPTVYFDHPGLPLQDVMAITVESRYLVHKLTHPHTTRHEYAAERLRHLGDSRAFFRGYAILFYVAGALFAFFALRRLLGNAWWGTAGTLLFLSAPGLQAMSIQFRPDVLLAGLALAVVYLIVRAAERRDAWLYTLATLLLGLTLTVKIHAIGLVVPLAIALLRCPPPVAWRSPFLAAARRWLHRYRYGLIAGGAIWLGYAVEFDQGRFPLGLTPAQLTACLELASIFFGYLLVVSIFAVKSPLRALARGPLRPFGGVLATAFAVGVVLPGTLVINDLPQMLFKMFEGLKGGGVNHVQRFATPWGELAHTPLLQCVILLGIAGIASAVGLGRRNVYPLLWFSGAAAMFVLATSRFGHVHYFAPAFVLSIAPALWLARELPGRVAVVGAVALVALTVIPVIRNLAAPAEAATLAEQRWAVIDRLGAELVTRPGTVALSEDYSAPVPGVRWLGLVKSYVAWTPEYPYRFMPDSFEGTETATELHLAPTYFIGVLPTELTGETPVTLPGGTYVLDPLPATMNRRLGIGAARLVSGPGVRPLPAK